MSNGNPSEHFPDGCQVERGIDRVFAIVSDAGVTVSTVENNTSMLSQKNGTRELMLLIELIKISAKLRNGSVVVLLCVDTRSE